MSTKTIFQLLIVMAMLTASFVLPANAAAGSAVCGGNVTVVSGDTLRKIADRCGTTVSALKLANNLSNANLIYVGQVLVMPGALIKGSNNVDIYIVNHGDTLKTIAALFNTTLDTLLNLNPAITNANLIYAGQRLNVPTPGTVPPVTPPPPPPGGQSYTVQKGDTMKKIAERYGISLDALIKANPQVTNINLIYVGQKLSIPGGVSVYVVVKGDTLRKIADRYGTTVEALLKLNPDIKNASLIYVGQVIKLK
jgi:spore coat assembly protein SafA